ncbi:MAG: D-alanine--D-alanine ligase [Patescibacteria group bacterium]|nr:D-alanine--D-alanine ligase [Patescibacteria group bacterium]
MQNKTIGVFFGSRSPEHDISIITAQLIMAGLRGTDFNVAPVYINQQGFWMLGEQLANLENFTSPQKNISCDKKYARYYLDLQQSKNKLVFKQRGIAGKTIAIDIAFPAFHGAYGEDGTIQGLFEMFNVPYVGCGVVSSAIAMDKALTKQICQTNDISTTKFICFCKNEWLEDKKAILERARNDLSWPVFVKPVHLGSSIGIAKVGDFAGLENKIEVALYYDDKVLIEEGVSDLMDITCCLIGNEKITPSLLQESVFRADLFDFQEKYLKEGGAQLGKSQSGVVIPARIEGSLTREIQKTAERVYRFLGCSGIARVDFLLNKSTGQFFANEVNPLPGTLYHHLWKASGVELKDLLLRLIDLAREKYQKKQDIASVFQSNVLQNLSSRKLNFKKSNE